MSDEKEFTPQEYKAQRLKENFALRCADYEDVIASLQTQVAMLQQQMKVTAPQAPTEDAEVVTDDE